MNTLELLVAARELISNPESWIQNDSTADEVGKPVEFNDERAVKFCMIGTIWHLTGDDNGNCPAARKLRDFIPKEFSRSLVNFNDAAGRTHAEVLAVFDAAIRQVKQEQFTQSSEN